MVDLLQSINDSGSVCVCDTFADVRVRCVCYVMRRSLCWTGEIVCVYECVCGGRLSIREDVLIAGVYVCMWVV